MSRVKRYRDLISLFLNCSIMDEGIGWRRHIGWFQDYCAKAVCTDFFNPARLQAMFWEVGDCPRGLTS